MCLIAIGCSHSSLLYGKSWPDYLAKKIGTNLMRASTPGGSNSSYIEKLNYLLKNNNPSLVVIQLTSPYRSLIGFKPSEPVETNYNLNDGDSFLNIGWYNWKIIDKNFANSKKLLNKYSNIIPADFYKFWSDNVVLSKWSLIKTMQDIFIMQSLCNLHNIPCIFYSWFYKFDDIFTDEYDWLRAHINYINGSAIEFFNNENIHSIPGNAHWNDDSHEYLVNNWIYPYIVENIKLNNILNKDNFI
jgi:hypothetical protein